MNQQAQTLPEDYDLKVDEQVNKFLELRHKLTYFLVTAAVGSLGFTLSAVLGDNGLQARGYFGFGVLVLAGIVALLVVAAALASLHYEIRSFQLHLRYRYQRKSIDGVAAADLAAWDAINKWARRYASFAFLLLGVSISAQVLYFSLGLYPEAEADMHHYGEDSLDVVSGAAGHQFIFTNKVSQARIVMLVPRSGAKENNEDLSDNDAGNLAREIAHLLRARL